MITKVIAMLVALLAIGGCGRENILPPFATPSGGTGAMSTGGAGGAPAASSFDAVEAIDRVSQVLSQQPAAEAPADLRRQAVAGALNTMETFAGAVRQLLDTGLSAPGVTAFYRWWLDLDHVAASVFDATLFPEATPDLLNAMAEETTTFGVQVTASTGGTFQTLLTAPFSFLNLPLANLYGVSRPDRDPASTGAFEQTDLPAGVRAGLLTQPSLQVLGSSSFRPAPTHRGSLTVQSILCQPTLSSPSSLRPLDPIPLGTTTRQALTADVDGGGATCKPCHDYVDPFGFAFGGFDVIGRVRALDNGGAVDTSSLDIIVFEPGGSTSTRVVNGPVELATLLATDPAAERCYLTKWLAFALGRGQTELPKLDDATFTAFAASGFNLKEGIVAVLTSDAFLTPAPPN
jgi:hypothetical protein